MVMLWASVAVALIVGLLYGSFLASLITLVAGAALTCLVVLPPWPMFKKHPVEFLSPDAESKHKDD